MKYYFCKIMYFMNILLILYFLYTIWNLYSYTFFVDDDLQAAFFQWKFIDSRFLSHIIEASCSYIPDKLLNIHPMDFIGKYSAFIVTYIFLLIIFCFIFPLWLFSKKQLFFKLISTFLCLAFFTFFTFKYIITNIYFSFVTYTEYIASFVPYVIFFSVFYYFILSNSTLDGSGDITKSELEKQRLLLTIGCFFGFLLGISIEIFIIISFLQIILSLLIFKKNNMKKYIFILLIFFLIGTLLYYNPFYLRVGLADRPCVGYSELYSSILSVQERIIPFFKCYYDHIIMNKYFICLAGLIILSYLPFFKINSNKKNIISISVLSMLIFFFTLIFIRDLSENQNQYWVTYFKFTAVYDLLTLFYLTYEIIIYISEKSNKYIKGLIILLIIFLVCDLNFDYEDAFNRYKNYNNHNKINLYILESTYVYYAKNNETAILPVEKMPFLEKYITKDIAPSDIHNLTKYPIYAYLKKIYGKYGKIPGYIYKSTERINEHQLDDKNINFTKLLNEYRNSIK